MQKIIKIAGSLLVLGALVLNTVAVTSAATNVFNDGFESGFSAWSTPIGSKWSSSSEDHEGSKSARVKGNANDSILKKTSLSTVGYNNVAISFWYHGNNDSLEESDYVKAEYTLDGTNWTTFFTIDDTNDSNSSHNDGWKQVTYNGLPDGADNNPNFGIRFKAKLNSEHTDEVNIDAVYVSGDQIQYKVLTVAVEGDGSVNSSPVGITCGADCDESYIENTIVTLTPVAATGSYFTGWGGACNGTGECSVTMSSAKNVTANFDTIKTTINATKVVCNSEADLPNWGNGGPDITVSTAADYVEAHPNCHLEDWTFEWALGSAPNPGDNLLSGGAGWTAFNSSTIVVGQEPLWVREQIPAAYVPFSGALQGQDDMESVESKNSAELYCQSDVLNYDNFDYIQEPFSSNTVHCVAFNVLKITDQCLNIPEMQSTVPEGMYKTESGDCLPNVSTVKICKVDDQNNNLSGWSLSLKGESVQSGLSVPTNISNGVDSNPLLSGVSYIAKSIGTWLNQGGANPVDTEYSTTDNWATQMDGYTGYSTDILELQINNSFDPNSDWGSYNSSHQYVRSFIPLVNGPANFRIFDGSGTTQNEGWFGDNIGSLTVDINKGYAGVTGEDGCTTFTNVPYGEYSVDEIMKDGWENISGLGNATVNEANETFTIVNKIIAPDPVDQCPNIDGVQATVPSDTHKDEAGDCVPNEVVQICTEKTMNVVSGTDDTASSGTSTILSFLHSAWDQTSLGTNWIWNMDGVTDPLSDETVTFTKNFTIPGAPISGTLNVLADNEYTGFVNSFTSIGATDGDNFLSPDNYTVPVENLINGSNAVSFTVKNWALADSTAQDNPAGLNYKLEVVYNECIVPEIPVNTPPTIALTGSSSITLTVGDTYTEQGATGNDAEDGVLTPVITGGPVTTGSTGTFTLTYTVTDAGGLTATVTRTVTVNSAPIIIDENPSTQCNDGLDNSDEEDSLIDMNDPGCSSPEDNDETNIIEQPPVFACNDGIDNDNDGKTDFSGESTDPGCSSNEDNDETNPINNPENPNNTGGAVPLAFLGSVNPPAPGRVLGATTTCGIYLEKFLRKGYKNDVESVKKVQTFLNDYFKLNIPVTGFFGPQTDSAVKKFQVKFSDEILKPWKLNGPTGIVYLTTTTKINKIMCPELDLQTPNLIPFEVNPESPKL